MLEGLMQDDFPLTLQHVLRRMREVYRDSEVATLTDDGVTRATYAEVTERVDRLCRALQSLGVGESDRVATFAWNSQRHLEVYLAAPCMGAVLHTVNVRLFPDQVEYIVNHARDRVVMVDDSLVPVLEAVADRLETVEHYVVMGDGDSGSLPNAVRYEELLAEQPEGYDYPVLDERQAAGLCYTSGTTGNPKGALYSHRSNFLHSMASCMTENLGIRNSDRVLPVVPMFHVNAWGLPYTSAMVGANLVMPGRFLQAEPLATLIESERVTVAAGVPTIWDGLLRYADEHGPDLSSIRLNIVGGSAASRALMEGFDRHGVSVVQAWGMTETNPLGAVAHPPSGSEGEERWGYRVKQGRLVPGIEARIVADDGQEAPWDGEATGELQVRGPWVARSYYEEPSEDDKFEDGWFRTGDICTIDREGFMKITDRTKDVIKSGGEWISSVDLELEIMAHPDVAEAAVISKPDERWDERPLACVVLVEGASASAEQINEHLSSRVARFWIPDEYAFIDEVPKTATGKFDKKVLRKRLDDDELAERVTVDAPQAPAP